jgi:hypothetical protein
MSSTSFRALTSEHLTSLGLNAHTQAILWRQKAHEALHIWREALEANGLMTPNLFNTIHVMLQKIATMRHTVAIIAEVARGKSELINALLFAQYGQRILPVGAECTTVCPIEFFCDFDAEPYLELLPIHTRLSETDINEGMVEQNPLAAPVSLRELLNTSNLWQRHLLDMTNPDAVASTIQMVTQLEPVSVIQAYSLGFSSVANQALLNQDGLIDTDAMVDVPSWRYARVNLHHPLLATGLSLLDTPGLNVVGQEMALTYEALPNIDAVIFLSDALIGLTVSEQLIWDTYLHGLPNHNKYLVFNKLDKLSDGIDDSTQLDSTLFEQVARSAERLNIDQNEVFAVSARQGLVARITNNAEALEQSRVAYLEASLRSTLLEKCELHMKQQVLQTLIVNYHVLSERLVNDVKEKTKQLNDLSVLRDSKERLYALHAYISDIKRRQDIENTIVFKLKKNLTIHAQTVTDKLSPTEVRNAFLGALNVCQTDALPTIQQHLAIGLAAVQLRLANLKQDLQTIRNTVAQALLKLQRVHATTSEPLQGNELDLIFSDLPTFSAVNIALVDMKRLAKQHKPSAMHLFPHLKLLHLTQAQRNQHTERIYALVEELVGLYGQVYAEFLPWFDELLASIQAAQVGYQTKLAKRYEGLLRMQAAQEDLINHCRNTQHTVQDLTERKHQLDLAYARAQTVLKASDVSEIPITALLG